MTRNDIINDYFEWLSDLVCKKRFGKQISYRKLLIYLHGVKFRYSIPRDENRAEDGISLRYRYSLHQDFGGVVPKCLDGPCSVLEMMVALAMKCEETMDDPSIGDRTGQWFWGMVTNLGLGAMMDDRFDRRYVEDVVNRFLDRDYEPDGKGGLFTIRNCDVDLRNVQIWYQMNWYLTSIT